MRRLGTTVALAALLAPAVARAQIVNVQPLLAKSDELQGFSISVEGSADIRRGNVNLLALSANTSAQYRAGRHLFFAMVRGDFSEKDGEPFVNRDLEHLRYRVRLGGPQSPFAWEAFAQHDRDAFRRLALRMLLGSGPRVRLNPWKDFSAAVGAAYMFEYEELAGGPEADAGNEYVDHRLSTYLVLQAQVTRLISLGETMYLQPRLDQWRDIRVLNEASLLTQATTNFSVKVALTSAYDSQPPIGVAPLDSTMKASFLVSF